MTPIVRLHDLGTIDYKEAWEYQEILFHQVIENKKEDKKPLNHLIVCEHPHVFTLGKSGDKNHLLANEHLLSNLNASFYKINRGGDITYHGPGQLVVYPIFDLDQFFTDIHKYMRYLEESVIKTLSEYHIDGFRIEGLTGVWVDENAPKKISAFGVKSSRWVTMHGIGFNVNTNLHYFEHIVPCGISDKQVTSMSQELKRSVEMKEVTEVFCSVFQQLFDFRWETN
ncbi:MAG: lipoyl(octanoyl) transferase LipB [Flavobacteriales bacterium]